MAEFTIQMVQTLKYLTKTSTLNCVRALEATNGDFDKAVEWLKKKGIL